MVNFEKWFHLVMTAMGSFALFYASQLVNTVDKLTNTVYQLNTTVALMYSDVKRHEGELVDLKERTNDRYTKSDHLEYKKEIDKKLQRLWDRLSKENK